MAQFEILHFKEFAAFINCELGATGFTCGVAYFAPNLPPFLPLYDLSGKQICIVEISSDYRASPTPETITSATDQLRFPICPT
jgi:hypothetical protein